MLSTLSGNSDIDQDGLISSEPTKSEIDALILTPPKKWQRKKKRLFGDLPSGEDSVEEPVRKRRLANENYEPEQQEGTNNGGNCVSLSTYANQFLESFSFKRNFDGVDSFHLNFN